VIYSAIEIAAECLSDKGKNAGNLIRQGFALGCANDGNFCGTHTLPLVKNLCGRADSDRSVINCAARCYMKNRDTVCYGGLFSVIY